MNNPLLQPSGFKHQAIDFINLRNEHFLPALDEAAKQARQRIAEVKSLPAGFEATIVGLESSLEAVESLSTIFFNLLSAHSNEQMQELAQVIGPKVSELTNDILLDDALFSRVRSVLSRTDKSELSAEQVRLLEKTYLSFRRNGALLSAENKQKLRQIDQRLAQLKPKYAENILKATNEFSLWITDPQDLSGLPDSAREGAAHLASEKGRPQAWLFNLQMPSYLPLLKFADKRELREQVWRAFASRSFGGTYDNQSLVREIAQLSYQRAKLLGYDSHAHFALEERMAEKPETVTQFLERLLQASKSQAERELSELTEFAHGLGHQGPLMPWDFSYYEEKLKQKKFGFDNEELRPYFRLENVIDGVFLLANKLFKLKFTPSTDYPVYHEDVRVYEVYKDTPQKEFIGLFYADFFPRASKRDGAWMTNYLEQGLWQGSIVRPHVSIVCNFTKPTSTKPSLLTLDEVRTLFHEFGHALHSLLSKCQYRSLSGTNVYWDFVELPSQIMENWALESEALALFARHYESGQVLPQELIEKVRASEKYMAGYYCLRQVNFALLDMAWYATDPSLVHDVSEYERLATARSTLLPKIPGTNISCSFGHIFGGGYAAGYYSYKWAEVLDADAFELFKDRGIFDHTTANNFETHILSKGGSVHPMVLFERFRGRAPDPDALLRRDGLIADAKA